MTKNKKHPTLVEVARKAGVGTTTVSRAINGGEHVDPKTLARIQRVVASLGYLPNQAARTLKGDRTRIIGLVTPSIADSFFASCAEAAQAVVRKHDSLLIVLTTQNDVQVELEAVSMLMRHRADGLIIAPAASDSAELRNLVRSIRVPVVAIDRPIVNSSVASVVADNFAGARAATQHLLEHGYKRIVYLTGETGLYTIQERMRGYQEAMQAAGLTPLVDDTVVDKISAERAVRKLFAAAKPPQAIFTSKNKITIDTFRTLQTMNLAIPEDVALIGYDDFELADTLYPSISVVQQPIEQIGQIAAELLFQQLGISPGGQTGGRAAHPVSVELKTRIVRRRSCGCHPPESET